METKSPIYAQAKEFAEGVHAVYPDKWLAYNVGRRRAKEWPSQTSLLADLLLPPALAVVQLVRCWSQRAGDEELRVGPRQAGLRLAVHHRECFAESSRRAPSADLPFLLFSSPVFTQTPTSRTSLPRASRRLVLRASDLACRSIPTDVRFFFFSFATLGGHEGLRRPRAAARARDWL